jgi:hypothetical protein
MKGSDTMKQCSQIKLYKKKEKPLGEVWEKISLKFALVQLKTHAHMLPNFLI